MCNVSCVEDALEQGERSVDVECNGHRVVWVSVVDDLDAVLDFLERSVEEVLIEIQKASKQQDFVKSWGATLPTLILVYT